MKIAVSISSYKNSPEDLIRAVQSVLGQRTRHELTLTVSVCGSKDFETIRLIRSLGVQCNLYAINYGFAGNWNRAVREAIIGAYDCVTMVHADDYLDPDHIQTLADSIGINDICFSGLKYTEPYSRRLIYAAKQLNPSLLWRKRTYIADPSVTVEDLLTRNTLPVPSIQD